MLNNDFDPYQALLNLDKNMQNIITAHNLLAKRVEEQSQIIDVLIDGLNNSNKANEHLMREMVKNIEQQIKEVK